jgi:hypothetical protein
MTPREHQDGQESAAKPLRAGEATHHARWRTPFAMIPARDVSGRIAGNICFASILDDEEIR